MNTPSNRKTFTFEIFPIFYENEDFQCCKNNRLQNEKKNGKNQELK